MTREGAGRPGSACEPGPDRRIIRRDSERRSRVSSQIPRRIIQTGKTSELSLLAQAAAANARLLNPDFEYIYFTDQQVEAFIDEHFPQHRQVFDAFRIPIQKYDFFRYLAIYRLGGFYMDLDVLLARPLTELLQYACVFPFEQLSISAFLRQQYGMDWEVGNYAFGAVPGHPFLRALIDNCIKAQTDPRWFRDMMWKVPRPFRDDLFVLSTTGPQLVSRTLAEFPNAEEHVKVLFPRDVCDQRSWFCFGSFGVHLMEGGWRPQRGLLRRRLMKDWQALMMKKTLKARHQLPEPRALQFGRP